MNAKRSSWILLLGTLLVVSGCKKSEQPGAVPAGEKGPAPASPGASAPKAPARPLKPSVGEAAKALEMDRGKLLFVSDLKPLNVTSGFSAPRLDTAWEGAPIEISGEIFDKGVGMHAPSTISFAVPPKAVAFQAKLGFHPSAAECANTAAFLVKDEKGKDLFVLPEAHPNSGSLDISVPLAGVKEITLVADEGGDGRDCDHLNWALASFVFPDAASRPAVKEQSPAAK